MTSPPSRAPGGDFEITSDPARIDVDAVHAFLTEAYWSAGIPRETVARAIAHSLAFALLHRGRTVGFARFVTDRATFAYLADVYVLPEHRGHGLGEWLVGTALAHPDLAGLRRMLLATSDMHKLYAKFGFRPLATPERLMEILDPDVYRRDR
ncbi:MAG: GNAT family N-acetyltransferase [Burkholderiales bacterium]